MRKSLFNYLSCLPTWSLGNWTSVCHPLAILGEWKHELYTSYPSRLQHLSLLVDYGYSAELYPATPTQRKFVLNPEFSCLFHSLSPGAWLSWPFCPVAFQHVRTQKMLWDRIVNSSFCRTSQLDLWITHILLISSEGHSDIESTSLCGTHLVHSSPISLCSSNNSASAQLVWRQISNKAQTPIKGGGIIAHQYAVPQVGSRILLLEGKLQNPFITHVTAKDEETWRWVLARQKHLRRQNFEWSLSLPTSEPMTNTILSQHSITATQNLK